jgi:hypothetical protein
VSASPPSKIAQLLRSALSTGDFKELSDLYASDALLDAGLPGGRRRAVGSEAAIEILEAGFPGPGRLVEWEPRLHPKGMALWFERVSDGAGETARQRHYLHVRDGRIRRHWAYAAPPRTPARGRQAGDGVLLETRLLSRIGQVAQHEPIVSTGWSGNLLERLVLADGRRLVVKRIVPGTNWMDRHTKDEGREALLFTSGVLGRLPEAIDQLVETGDEGNPLLQLMAVLAAAESGDLREARRLRARWGRTQIRDWASDVAVLLQAEAALHLGDEPELTMATVQLLPFRGRQAVLGTPAFSLGAYDEVLGRIAERTGDTVAARDWWTGAREQGRKVGSPQQVALAEAHLARVPAETARRPPRRRPAPPTPRRTPQRPAEDRPA